VLGLVMMFSASYAHAYYYMDNSFYYIARQAAFAVLGVAAMLIISLIDYHILHKFAWLLYLGTIPLLALVFFMPAINDAHRWIFLGPVNFQPSEIAKFALILVCSHIISINHEKMGTFRYGVLPFLVLGGIYAAMIVVEPHLSCTVLIVALTGIMIFVGGAKLRWFAAAAGIAAAGVAAIMMTPSLKARAMARISIWQDPSIDPLGGGFQTLQSLYAIGSGGLLGAGIGNSRQKYLFLPEPQNDYVFSVICEELGFVGAVFIIVIFALLICRGFIIAVRARDRFGTMLAMGITAQIGIQAVLNIAVVTNTVPSTGISLPFFSYGGTSLLMLLMQVGVVLSVSRQTAMEKE